MEAQRAHLQEEEKSPGGGLAPVPVPPGQSVLTAPDAGRDPALVDLAASGEVLVSRVRLVLVLVLLAMQLVPGPLAEMRRVTVPLNLVALVVTLLFWWLTARRPRPWLEGFASSAADVTLVSAGLAAFLLLGQPQAAVGSRTLFDLYFLAIACASLRYNPQACAFTGLLAIAQYGAVVAYAAARWDLNDARFGGVRDGPFDWSQQGARLILLGAAAVIGALTVQRASGLRRLSGTDRLTGVANRRAFDQHLAAEADRAHRSWRPVAVAVLDVDDFKRINDSLGHAAGDAVLRAVAGALVGAMRRSDLVARLGGDEFALLLPETSAELVVAKLVQLRAEVGRAATAAARARAADAPPVTVSVGVASWPDDGVRMAQVLAVADRRLYEAKRAGRDRLVGPPAAAPSGASGAPADLVPWQ
jgi:diguanylate cyclase (GGDEF)-like protein